jgi:hypothetical protein
VSHRYIVRRLSGPLHWGIFDTALNDWCRLKIDAGWFVPLEWKSAEEAAIWLYLCRVAWGGGLIAAPDGWNEAPEQSRCSGATIPA